MSTRPTALNASAAKEFGIKEPFRPSAWQNELKDRGVMLDYLLTSGKFSDVTLSVGKHKKAFKAHKLVLASRSPLFEEMFYSEKAYGSNVIPLEEDDTLAMQWILQHIYCDRSELHSIDLAFDVFRVSAKFLFTTAYQYAIEHIKNSIKRNDVLRLYSKIYKENEAQNPLIDTCRKIFSENGNCVLISSFLHEITSDCFQSLLNEDLRVTSEVAIFKAIIFW